MREAIFEAAVIVLGEHGVEGMTMDRVRLAAGVAKGSLYRYFRSKRDLLQLVYAKVIDPIFDDLAQTVTTEQPAIEKLATHLRRMLEHLAKHEKVFKILIEDETAQGILRSSQRSSCETGSQRLAGIMRQGIAEGVLRPADPRLLAHMYLGLWKGAFDSLPELEEPDQREYVHRLILGTFLNGVATEKGRLG